MCSGDSDEPGSMTSGVYLRGQAFEKEELMPAGCFHSQKEITSDDVGAIASERRSEASMDSEGETLSGVLSFEKARMGAQVIQPKKSQRLQIQSSLSVTTWKSSYWSKTRPKRTVLDFLENCWRTRLDAELECRLPSSGFMSVIASFETASSAA